jgi:hypothetical protein
METEIRSALQVLIGETLWSSGRAADLQWFQFGQRRTVTDFRGRAKEVGEYALHVQCAWRIRSGDSVTVGSRDLYFSKEDSEDDQSFDWQVQGASKLDQRITELFENGTREFFVSNVQVGNAGSFTIVLESNFAMEVFPYESSAKEHWRFFRPYSDEAHFVVSGKGIGEGE